MADMMDSKSIVRKGVRVQIPPPAQNAYLLNEARKPGGDQIRNKGTWPSLGGASVVLRGVGGSKIYGLGFRRIWILICLIRVLPRWDSEHL